MSTKFSNIFSFVGLGNCLFTCTFSCCQDKLQAIELWQLAVQELNRLKQNISDGKVLEADRQQLQVGYCMPSVKKQTILSPLDGAIATQMTIIQCLFSALMHTVHCLVFIYLLSYLLNLRVNLFSPNSK